MKALIVAISALSLAATAAHDSGKPFGLFAGQQVVQSLSGFTWGPVTNGLSIGLAPASAHFVVGSPIDVRIALRNVTAKARSFNQMSMFYSLSLRDQNGAPVHELPDVYFGTGSSAGGNILTITPGDAVELTRDLGKQFPLHAGQYTLVATAELREAATYHGDDQRAIGLISSAPLTLKLQ